ncbi:MAG: flagellar hook-length control protein FliK [Betaproteobacteria bacterium]|nr:flagellar hook-length control protein FliK [Betaproteobacteria bacterium]
MIDELRVPLTRGAFAGRPAASEDRGGGGFGVALGDALEPAATEAPPLAAQAFGRRAASIAQARPDPAADGNPAERLLRARRQADRQHRSENRPESRPAPRAEGARAERDPEHRTHGADEAGKLPEAPERPEAAAVDPPSTWNAAAEGDAGQAGPAGEAGSAAARPGDASLATDAAGLGINPASPNPRTPAAKPTGAGNAAQTLASDADPLATAGGATRPLPASAARAAITDPMSSGSAAQSRQTLAAAVDATAPGMGGGAGIRPGGSGAGSGAPPGAELRAADSPPPGSTAPRRDGTLNGLAAALAGRIDWRPAAGAAGAQGGDSHSPGSGDMGAPARLLAALEDMRQSGGSASPQGAAAFAAALSASQSQAFAPVAPGMADAQPVRLANPWPIDHPAFPAHLAEQVGDSLLAGLDRAEITVTPPEMGPIRIELSLNGEQASVAFSATQPDTRTAIEQSLPLLKSMLSEQGLQLADTSVGSGYRPPAESGAQSSAGDGGGARDPGGSQARAGGSGGAGGTSANGSGVAASAARGNGLLDLFA